MSKKIILNDNELVTNEDVEQGIDWRGRDLYRWLEAYLQNTFSSDPGTGFIEGGAIISGLEMTFSSVNLDVTISPGSALMAVGGEDASLTNSFQMGSSESDVVLPLPVAHATLYRWDLIECSVSQIVTRESRKVLSTGPIRTLSPTDVDKFQDNVLQFRVRSGTPDTSTNALLPFLQPDPAWLPMFAVRVDPGRFRLLGSGIEPNAQNFDLRKLLSRSRPDPALGHGFQYPVSLASSGAVVQSHRNWVQMDNYNSPVAPGFYITTFAGVSSPPTPIRPSANVNGDKAQTLTLAVDTWYYLYGYRPHVNSGYTAMFFSGIPPETDLDAPTGKMATGALVLPVPFKPDVAPTQYMGAVRLALSGGSFLPRGFRQNSGYVAMGTVSRAGLAGATGAPTIYDASVGVGLATLDLIGIADGILTVPPHCRMARIHFSFLSGPAPGGVTVYSVEDFSMYSKDFGISEREQIILDIPLGFSLAGVKEFKVEVVGSAVSLRAYVLGYYEELP